jgi:hypothetical protein
MPTLNRAILYGLGPFFGHPLKPLLSYAFGDGYATAYRHFRRDHSRMDNLVLHLVCLVFQLLSNFALLATLDDALFSRLEGIDYLGASGGIVPVGKGVAKLNLSTATAAAWIVCLAFSEAPAICSACSAFSIVGALLATSAAADNGDGESIPGIQWVLANIQTVCICTFWLVMFAAVGPTKLSAKKAKLAVIVTILATLWECVSVVAKGSIVDEGSITAAYAGLLGLLLGIPAVLTDPVTPVVLSGVVFLNLFAVLCEGDQLVLRFWAMAYVCMGLQGAAHDVSSQPATLLNLQADESGDRKIRFEWSHVTFFPDLLFHSCHESLSTKASKASKKTK